MKVTAEIELTKNQENELRTMLLIWGAKNIQVEKKIEEKNEKGKIVFKGRNFEIYRKE